MNENYKTSYMKTRHLVLLNELCTVRRFLKDIIPEIENCETDNSEDRYDIPSGKLSGFEMGPGNICGSDVMVDVQYPYPI